MELTVIKEFVDRQTKTPYRINDTYLTGDQDRAVNLVELRYLEKTEETIPPNKVIMDISILDGNVTEITKKLTNETPKTDLESFLESEKNGKNRVTVIEHIESLLV